MNKIVIIGCSGSGKSTLARELGTKLKIQPVDLDTLRFPNGFLNARCSDEVFVKAIKDELVHRKWILEGVYYNYDLENVLWRSADVVIWLDFPLRVIWARVFRRSTLNVMRRCNKSGMKVGWETEFGEHSVIREVHKIHNNVREYYPDVLSKVKKDTKVVVINNVSSYDRFIDSVPNE